MTAIHGHSLITVCYSFCVKLCCCRGPRSVLFAYSIPSPAFILVILFSLSCVFIHDLWFEISVCTSWPPMCVFCERLVVCTCSPLICERSALPVAAAVMFRGSGEGSAGARVPALLRWAAAAGFARRLTCPRIGTRQPHSPDIVPGGQCSPRPPYPACS